MPRSDSTASDSRRDNVWAACRRRLPLGAVFSCVIVAGCFAPRTNPLDPANPNYAEQFDVSVAYDYRIVADNGGRDSVERYAFRAQTARDDILLTVWTLDIDGDGGSEVVDTVDGTRFDWSRTSPAQSARLRPAARVEAIAESGARGTARIEAIACWTVFDSENGLVGDTATCLAVDSSGLLWVGLESGHIACYIDSAGWQLHQPPKPSAFGRARELLVAPDGAVWVSVIPFYDQGGIRPGGGLWRFGDGAWSSQGFTDRVSWVRSLALEGDHTIWITTDALEGEGIYTFDLRDTVIASVSVDSQFFESYEIAGGYTMDIINVSSGTSDDIWMGSTRAGLVYHDGRSLWEHIGPADGLPGDGRVQTVSVSEDGDLWIGTARAGVALREAGSREWISLDEQSGLPGNRVFAFAPDSDSRIWVGLDRGLGYIERRDGRWRAFDTGRLRESKINALLVHNRVLWIATEDGLIRYHYPRD